MTVRMLFSGVLIASSLMAPFASADPIVIWYTVQNNDKARSAMDLTLQFNLPIDVNKTGDPVGAKSANFGSPETVDTKKAPNTIEFLNNQNLVMPGAHDQGTLQLSPPKKAANATVVSAAWSYRAGANLAIPVNKIIVTVGKKDDGFISITNDGSQTVYFSNVLASTDLPSSEFLDTSDAALDARIANQLFATGAEPDFSLGPMTTWSTTLGPDTGDNYTSVVFTEDLSLTPSSNAVRLGFAGNAEVPEPSFFSLLGLGSVLIASSRWMVLTRRRRAEA